MVYSTKMLSTFSRGQHLLLLMYQLYTIILYYNKLLFCVLYISYSLIKKLASISVLIIFRLNMRGYTFYQQRLVTSASKGLTRILMLFLMDLCIIYFTYISVLGIVVIRLCNYILNRRIRRGVMGIGQYNQIAYIEDSISQ